MKRIRILATSDLHGYIYPNSYIDGKPCKQGISQLSTLIESLRDENTLLLDNGDTLEGSPLTFYHYHTHPTEVNPMTSVMHDMHYDYVNVGNHDFNYGEDALMMHLQNIGANCITSNFLFHGKPYGPTYVIREFEDIKVAIIAVTTQYIPHWETKAHIKHSKFMDAFETLKKNVELVKKLEKPDYIIGMYHGGFERDFETGYLSEEDTGENQASKMMNLIPDLDILISGHQHRTLCGKGDHCVYTQTAANGVQLACIDIYPENNTIEPRILDGEGIGNTEITKYIQPQEDECQAWLDQPLGTTNIDLTITDENEARLHKSQVITFINQIQMKVTGADIASCALFLHATGFPKNITMRNLLSTYVYPNTLVIKEMSGKVLKEYLEKDAEFWVIKADGTIGVNPSYDYPKPQHYNYDMLDGIEYTIKVTNPVGSRIVSLTRDGKDIQDDDVFKVCLNNYRATGGGNFAMIPGCKTVGIDLHSMIELLAEEILKQKVIDFEPVNNISVIR